MIDELTMACEMLGPGHVANRSWGAAGGWGKGLHAGRRMLARGTRGRIHVRRAGLAGPERPGMRAGTRAVRAGIDEHCPRSGGRVERLERLRRRNRHARLHAGDRPELYDDYLAAAV